MSAAWPRTPWHLLAALARRAERDGRSFLYPGLDAYRAGR